VAASGKQIYLADELATVAAGEKLGRCLARGGVLYLIGVLGAGKTTLCRGILRSFGHSAAVKSPTYTLVEPYELGDVSVYHFDLYRLGDPEELEYMGIRDYFQGHHVCLIEWPDKGYGFLPEADITAELKLEGTGRGLPLEAFTPQGKSILQDMEAKFIPDLK